MASRSKKKRTKRSGLITANGQPLDPEFTPLEFMDAVLDQLEEGVDADMAFLELEAEGMKHMPRLSFTQKYLEWQKYPFLAKVDYMVALEDEIKKTVQAAVLKSKNVPMHAARRVSRLLQQVVQNTDALEPVWERELKQYVEPGDAAEVDKLLAILPRAIPKVQETEPTVTVDVPPGETITEGASGGEANP